jgi:hypothetical protein
MMTDAISTGNTTALESIENFQATMTKAIEAKSVERNNILYGIEATVNEKGEVVP